MSVSDCFLVSCSEHATGSSLPSEDWGVNMEICDIVNETDDGCVCRQIKQISVYVVITIHSFLQLFPSWICTPKMYLEYLNGLKLKPDNYGFISLKTHLFYFTRH